MSTGVDTSRLEGPPGDLPSQGRKFSLSSTSLRCCIPGWEAPYSVAHKKPQLLEGSPCYGRGCFQRGGDEIHDTDKQTLKSASYPQAQRPPAMGPKHPTSNSQVKALHTWRESSCFSY